jgi:hypothetical protein
MVRGNTVKAPPVGADETQRAVVQDLDDHAAFVHRPMVEPAH